MSIEKWQIKTIYTLANGIGLVDKSLEIDPLHEMIFSMTKKKRVTELTRFEASNVIDRLKGNMKGTKYKTVPASSGMVSRGQEKKIWALIFELKKYDAPDQEEVSLGTRLKGFMKKYANVDDLRFLTDKNANKVIEGLKGLIQTEKRRKQ